MTGGQRNLVTGVMDIRELRRHAEDRLSRRKSAVVDSAPIELRGLIHELSVHKVELDLQNEELRSTHDELELARNRYYDLYEEAPVAYLTVSGSGALVAGNRMATTVLQLKPESYSRRRILDLLAPAFHARFAERSHRLTGGGGVESFEALIRRQDGTRFWALLHMTAAGWAQGGDAMLRVAIIDIDERKRADAAMSRLAAIVTSSNLVVFSHDLSGVITSWNEAAAKLLGYPADRIIGKNSSLLLPPERKGEDVLITSRLARGEQVACETIRVRSDGELMAVGLVASPVFNDAGTMIGVSQVMRDARELVSSREAQRQQMNQLRDHQAVLEAADRRKDEMIATLAHELRDPLAAIRNAAALLGHDAEMDRRSRETIERQVAQMAHLVEDLSDVTRMHHDLVVVRTDLLQVSTVLRFAVETVGHLVRRCEHRLQLEIPEDGLPIRGEMSRLVQVFGNLIGNAAKYTPPRGNLWLTAASSDGDAVIRIRDSGIGMDGDFLPRAFDLFSQAGEAIDRPEGGLGIGLYLVKRLVDLHRGSVTVTSEGIGKGCEFIVRLPLATDLP